MTARIGVALLLTAMLAACDPVGKAWDQAQSANTIDAYQAFLAANPDSEYEAQARQRIDDLAWETASAANSEESYAKYQTDYPDGAHLQESAERIHKVRVDDFNANFDAQLLAFVRLEDSAIVTIQGKSWDDLRPRVGVVSGGFDVVGGAAILRKGSVAVYEDRDKQFRIFGVMDQPQYALDAKPASLQGSEFEPGVRIGLVSGETLEYGDDGWHYVAEADAG
ncbi:MAG: hypothetical protein WB812_01505 [Woeseiaceae bacterium]